MIVFSDLNAPVFQKALDAHTFRQRLLKFSSNREAVGVFGELVRADGWFFRLAGAKSLFGECGPQVGGGEERRARINAPREKRFRGMIFLKESAPSPL